MAHDSTGGHTDGESEDPRSSFGRVVESVDAVIHRHPAGGARIGREPDRDESPCTLPENVIDLGPPWPRRDRAAIRTTRRSY